MPTISFTKQSEIERWTDAGNSRYLFFLSKTEKFIGNQMGDPVGFAP